LYAQELYRHYFYGTKIIQCKKINYQIKILILLTVYWIIEASLTHINHLQK